MDDHPVTCLEDLDQLLEELKKSDWSGSFCYLRGQPANYPLIPSLGRRYKGKAFFKIEELLLESFKKQYTDWHRKNGQSPEIPIPPEELNEWQWAAIAQHYGLPTRLLDWSRDRSVAMFFAVADRNDNERRSDGAVYLFHDKTIVKTTDGVGLTTPETDPFRVKNVRPYRPLREGLELPRIKAQTGALTTQPNPMEDLVPQLKEGTEHKFLRCVVPRQFKSKIRQALEEKEITEATLFPELDGLCRHVAYEILGD